LKTIGLLLSTLLLFGINYVNAREFKIENNSFVKDGEIIQIVSSELHYFRIHPSYWADRLQRVRALGANTIQVYIPWNFHETTPGVYDFSGWKDVNSFFELANAMDLLVFLRPGPYICAEWDFGGFPGWILDFDDPPIQNLRTYDEGYLKLVERWWRVLFAELQPSLYENGGPIVMSQVENEYGFFGDVSSNDADLQYMLKLVDLARQGLGDNVILYTTDGGSLEFMKKGSIYGSAVFTAGDFGPGASVLASFEAQKEMNAEGMSPGYCSEYYTGWLTHWGEEMANTSSASVAETLTTILSLNGSVSLYMGHGGSNFGFWNGANGDQSTENYQAHITSYDYDAPISEAGDHGYGSDGEDKFEAIRAVIQKYATWEIPDEPEAIQKVAYNSIELDESCDLYTALNYITKKTILSNQLLTMEKISQQFGFMMYSTVINTDVNNIMINGVRDRAQVFVDHVYVGETYRVNPNLISLPFGRTSTAQLDIFVENMGRLNFGVDMNDPKGIVGNVSVNDGSSLLNGDWTIYSIPLDDESIQKILFQPKANTSSGPVFYRGYLEIDNDSLVHDTFINFECWVKGVVWVNGFNLGRYWNLGPQQTIYVPAPLLTVGSNEVIVFELESASPSAVIKFSASSIFNTTSVTC